MSYVYLNSANVDIDWTSFKYLGENAATKRGVEINNASVNIQYSVIQECEDFGLYINAAATMTNIAAYNIGKVNVANNPSFFGGAGGVNFANVSNVIVMAPSALSTYLFYFTATAILPSGLTIAGLTGSAVYFSSVAGTLDLNNAVIHSCSVTAVTRSIGGSDGIQDMGTIKNATIWRLNALAITFSTGFSIFGCQQLTLQNLTLWGNNATSGLSFSGLGGEAAAFWNKLTLISITSNNDSSFSVTNGIAIGATFVHLFVAKMINCDFSTVSGIKTAHTNDITLVTGAPAGGETQIIAHNCKFGGTNVFTDASDLSYWFLKSQKHNQTAGSHRKYSNYGVITIDTVANMFRTASPSERLTPNNASNKLESGSKKVAVLSGQAATVSVYARESVVGDGTDYNGARPRLILKRNDAIGITADTVIDTNTVTGEGAFELLSGTTAAASDDGVMEFYVDCDGTTGWVNVDDWSVT